MNWDAIGAVGVILGALAVVITLVYLALQILHAKATAADANRLARASGTHTAALTTAMDGEVQQALIKSIGASEYYEGFAQDFGLTYDEAGRADIWNVSWFWLHWGQYRSIN